MSVASGPIEGDAFGQALLARQEGRAGDIVAERDDGMVELDAFDYFSLPQGPLRRATAPPRRHGNIAGLMSR